MSPTSRRTCIAGSLAQNSTISRIVHRRLGVNRLEPGEISSVRRRICTQDTTSSATNRAARAALSRTRRLKSAASTGPAAMKARAASSTRPLDSHGTDLDTRRANGSVRFFVGARTEGAVDEPPRCGQQSRIRGRQRVDDGERRAMFAMGRASRKICSTSDRAAKLAGSTGRRDP